MVLADSDMGEAVREDDRTASQIRALSASRGLLNRAHGSAKWSQGDTTVLAAVFGPQQAEGPSDDTQKARIEVVWQPMSGHAGRDVKAMQVVVRRTIESAVLSSLLPRTRILLTLQVMHDDGSLLACAINASCLALLDAGIPLSFSFGAVCYGVRRDNYGGGGAILDPTKAEERTSAACISLVLPLPSKKAAKSKNAPEEKVPSIITSETNGSMTGDEYFVVVEQSQAACEKLGDFFRKTLEHH